MRKKYLSALLFGALLVTSAGTFTSCKDYDDEINGLQEQIDKVVKDLETLKTTVDNLGGVTAVKIEGGKLIVTAGGKDVSYDLPAGGDVEKTVVELDGQDLKVDGKVIGQVGDKVTVNEEGYLCVNGDPTEIKAGKYAVLDNDADGVVTITLPDANGELKTVELVKASANVDIKVTTTGSQNKVISCLGNAGNSTNLGIEWGVAAGKVDWKGPKGAIAEGQLLVGQTSSIQLTIVPATYDLSKQELKFIDSEGNFAPVVVKPTAKETEGPITGGSGSRAASSKGEWDLTVEMKKEVTGENIGKVFANEDNDENILYALTVNGKIVSGYDYIIDTNVNKATKPSTGNYYDLAYGHVKVNGTACAGGSVAGKVGENILSLEDKRVCDYYFEIADESKNDALAYNVKLEGNKLIAGNEAANKPISLVVRALDVMGNIVKPSDPSASFTTDARITVTFGETEAGDAIKLPESTYKVTDKEVSTTKKIKLNLGEAFTGLTPTEAIALTQVALSTEDDKFIVAKNSIASATIKYYSDEACTKEVKFNDAQANIRNIKYATLTYTSVNANATVGEHIITMTQSTANGEFKKFDIPVIVTVPEFSEIFTTTDMWGTDGKLNSRISYDSSAKINLSGAYKYDNNVSLTYLTLDVEQIKNGSNNIIGTNASGVINISNITNNNKELVFSEIKVTPSYEIAGIEGFVVEGEQFTANVKSIADGIKVVYLDAEGNEAEKATITGANKIKIATYNTEKKKLTNGLAVKFANGVAPLRNTDANTDNTTGFEFYGSWGTKDNESLVVKLTTPNLNHVTVGTDGAVADSRATEYELNGLVVNTSSTLRVSFEDATGVVINSDIKF